MKKLILLILFTMSSFIFSQEMKKLNASNVNNYTGKGVYIYDNGKYEGDWKNGNQTGKGVLIWSDGDKYEGDFVDGNQMGKGVYIWASGNKYEGDWKNGNQTGKGVFTWSNGDKYEGDFVDGNQTGKGVFTWSDGDKYEGDFVEDNRTGKGIYTWSNGDKYEGDFKEGKLIEGIEYAIISELEIKKNVYIDGNISKSETLVADSLGFFSNSFDINFINKDTGTEYDKNGYDFFGIHKTKDLFSVLSDTRLGEDKLIGELSKTLTGHIDEVMTVCYSPDGKYLASGSIDGTIRIWDVSSGKEIKTLAGRNGYIYSVCYSPDGKYLASGISDKTIRIWDVSSGKEVKTLAGHSDYVRTVCYSPDGKYLASGSDDKVIKIWNMSSGKEAKTIIGHSSSVRSVCYSPNGKYLASGGGDKTIRIWDVPSGKEVKTLAGHSDSVNSICYSPDGKYLASGSWDKAIKIWDVGTGKELESIEHDYSVFSLCYSPNGKYLVSGSSEIIKIWDATTGKEIETLEYHSGNINSVCYSPNGKYLACVSYENTIKIVEMWGTYKTIKALIKIKTNITNETGEIIGVLPQGIVADISIENKKIHKPLKGFINTSDFEPLYNNIDNVKFCTLENTPVYINAEKTKVLTNIEKGKIIDKLYYSFDLDMYYIENGSIKGWITYENIDILKKQYNKVTIINNNTNSYKVIGGMINSTYNSGDILEFDNINSNSEYFYSDSIGWLNKKDTMLIEETPKAERVFVNNKDTKFNSDFTGNNYKNVAIGTEYKLLGTADKYYLVESKSTGEKGWILKSDMNFTKPDLNDPVILITSTSVDKNNMLTISGKIYDDTAISSFLLNGNKITTKPLSTFDKLSYTPEVGYSFTSQWFLIEGMENNIDIEVKDREGKTTIKSLKYSSELKRLND